MGLLLLLAGCMSIFLGSGGESSKSLETGGAPRGGHDSPL